ncbi:hypothetical protein L218DRAFT_381541 [Marasmius fiardii PR-910]|nr:hypothetical protein L218DRAFT_381541 [Marasmius fiardii PR-910]
MECMWGKFLFNSVKATVGFSVLNTVLQVVLQAVLIPVGSKAYNSQSCLGTERSSFGLLSENILLIALHLLALSLHIIAVTRSLTSFIPYLLILFGLSLGSSVAQLVQVVLRCQNCGGGVCPTVSGTAAVTATRFCLSLGFFIVLVLFMTPWKASFIKQSAKRASIPSFIYLVAGTVAIGTGGDITLFFYVWVGFTAVLAVTAIGLSLMHHALRGPNTPTITRTITVDPSRRNLHSEVHNPVSWQRQPSIRSASLAQTQSNSITTGHEDPVDYSMASATSRSSKAGWETLSSALTSTRRESKSTEVNSMRSSVGEETFHTAVHSRRTSIRSVSTVQVPSSEPIPDVEQSSDSARVRDSVRSVSDADVSPQASVSVVVADEPQPPRSPSHEQLLSLHSEITHNSALPSRRFTTSAVSAEQTSIVPNISRENRQSEPPRPLVLRIEPSPFPSSSSSPVPPPSPTRSVAASTPTVPPYPYSPYSYRPRHDTLASNRTYETLPSYHSRRSSQTLADIMAPGPSTPRNGNSYIRSLPPLPPLPPFISLSSILLTPGSVGFTTAPNSPDTPTLDDDNDDSHHTG